MKKFMIPLGMLLVMLTFPVFSQTVPWDYMGVPGLSKNQKTRMQSLFVNYISKTTVLNSRITTTKVSA